MALLRIYYVQVVLCLLWDSLSRIIILQEIIILADHYDQIISTTSAYSVHLYLFSVSTCILLCISLHRKSVPDISILLLGIHIYLI